MRSFIIVIQHTNLLVLLQNEVLEYPDLVGTSLWLTNTEATEGQLVDAPTKPHPFEPAAH